MAIAVATTRQALADAYKNVGGAGANVYVGAATGNPGSGPSVTNEATGGSPAYARVATTWTSGSGGVINGSAVTLNVAAGNYQWIVMCSAASGANMTDASDTTDVTMSAQGTLVVTPVYTQT